MDMSEVPEAAGLHDTTFNGDFMMAVPLVIFRSGKWQGRGKALFDAKTDALVDYAIEIGIENGFIQESGTVSPSYIPVFDGTGL